MAMADYAIHDSQNAIRHQPWYWGKVTKEEACKILMKLDHGHFLVRDSTQAGEYTLVVRRKQRVRNIRILQGDQGYGVVEEKCHFADVADLIHHLQDNPHELHENFPMIDLVQPVCKPETENEETTYELLSRLVLKNKDWILQDQSFSNRIRKRKLTIMEMQQSKTTTLSLNVVLSLFEEQLTLQTMHTSADLMKPVGAVDPQTAGLKLNRATLQERVSSVRSRLQQQQAHYRTLQDTANRQLGEIQQLKPLHASMQQELTLLRLRVEERDIDNAYLDLLLKEEKSSTDLSHYNRNNWFVQCDRGTAERVLADRVPGTFLVRPNRDGGLALSIMCAAEDKVEARHCLIHQNPKTGYYGFHPEYCIMATLEELVIKHQTISLKFYNSRLDVCLTYPVNYRKDDDD